MQKLNILSFNALANLWVDEAPDFYEHCMELTVADERLPKVFSVIENYDIAMLQEVDYHSELEAACGKQFHILHSFHDNTLWQPHSGKRHGNTILVRRELVKGPITSQSVKLSDDGNVALIVRFRIGAVPITIVNVHLECEENVELISGTEYSIRRHQQSKRLLKHIPNTDVVILGGDFNAPLSTPELSHLTSEGGFVDLTSAHLGRSEYDHNMHVYTEPVDAILVKGSVTQMQIHRFAYPPTNASVEEKIAFLLRHYGSDHHCVGLTVSFNPPRHSVERMAPLPLVAVAPPSEKRQKQHSLQTELETVAVNI